MIADDKIFISIFETQNTIKWNNKYEWVSKRIIEGNW
jgi:hypothetical protein